MTITVDIAPEAGAALARQAAALGRAVEAYACQFARRGGPASGGSSCGNR